MIKIFFLCATIALISYWAGFLTAALLANQEGGEQSGRTESNSSSGSDESVSR